MPAFGGAGAAVHTGVQLLLYAREVRAFARIDAHGDDVVIFADVQRDVAQAGFHTAQHLRAQHRAAVIHQREHHGLLAEVLAEGHGVAVLITEREVERNRLIELLVDADFLEQLRANADALHGVAQLSASARRRCKQRARQRSRKYSGALCDLRIAACKHDRARLRCYTKRRRPNCKAALRFVTSFPSLPLLRLLLLSSNLRCARFLRTRSRTGRQGLRPEPAARRTSDRQRLPGLRLSGATAIRS